MIFIKVYGVREHAIGYDEFFVKCPACEAHNWADVMVISKYYHFYFIPMWPINKEANVICKRCGLKRYGISFNSVLISNFEEKRSHFRHPWFTYFGLIIISLITIAFILQFFL
jgi:hypothetical protein